jgi:hypothetical protein
MGVIGHGAHTLFQKNMVLQVLVSQVWTEIVFAVAATAAKANAKA